MARTAGTMVENNLSKGLVTEASGLTFPENAVVEAENVVFSQKGNVERREGFNLELDREYAPYSPVDGVVREFFWGSSGKINNTLYLVLQVGSKIFFYDVNNVSSVSSNKFDFEIDLGTYKTGLSDDLRYVPCVFAAGLDYLFIVNPNIDPLYVKWDEDDQGFVVNKISPKIRDFEGVDDGLDVEENPTTLSNEHHYNLKNQGWYKEVRVGSANNEV